MARSKASSRMARPPVGAGHIPKYGLHKPSGRAVLYLDRRPVYLGEYDSPESWERYWQLIAEHGTPEQRRIPVLTSRDSVSVAALVERYLADAVESYGRGNEYLDTIRAAVAPLLELHASTAVKDFGPMSLKAVRTHRINQGRKRGRKAANGRSQEWKPVARVYINKLIRIIIGIFRWGVEEELVPAGVWESLKAVIGLRKGKDRRVRECKPIKPVPDGDVDAVLKTVTPEIAAMIRLQTLTAARPDEVTGMRPADIDSTGEIWVYTLGDRSQGGLGHKTDHLDNGGDKYICLGPKAQAIIKPFLANCPPTEFLFSPKRAAARRYPNGNRGLKPKARYDDDTYCRAVKRGCKRAGVPIWTPNRLRHNRATEVRTVFGLEAAQAVLDHRSIETTQIYAEKQTHLKREVALKIG